MPEQFKVELVDHALLEELQMTTDLIVAANQSDGALSLTEIDRILGVVPIAAETQLDAAERVGSEDLLIAARAQLGVARIPRPRSSMRDAGDEQIEDYRARGQSATST